MAFRPRRQLRYEKLRDSGFLPFEARALSKVPPQTPYMIDMITERRKFVKDYRTKGFSDKQIVGQLKQYYIDNEFLKHKIGKRATLDPWKMLRHWEDQYKDHMPDYTSPWQKRQKSWVKYTAKAEKTLARQRGWLE